MPKKKYEIPKLITLLRSKDLREAILQNCKYGALAAGPNNTHTRCTKADVFAGCNVGCMNRLAS